VLTTPRRTQPASCTRFLDRIDSEHLDCISDAVALVLAHAGVDDVRSPFAADWRFDLADRDAPCPRLDLPPVDLTERLAHRTGYTLSWHQLTSLTEALPIWRALLAAGTPVLVVGDAFGLPWVPYAGHEHMDHGFVLDDLEETAPGETLVQVTDPYDNTTEWGRAQPQTTTVPLGDLTTALDGGRWGVLRRTGAAHAVDVADCVRANVASVLAAQDRGDLHRFVDAHRQLDRAALDNLTLQTWLLARNRALHGRWLADVAPTLAGLGLDDLPDRFDATVVRAWRRASEASYLALRRLRGGRAVPPACLAAATEAVGGEADLANNIATSLGSNTC